MKELLFPIFATITVLFINVLNIKLSIDDVKQNPERAILCAFLAGVTTGFVLILFMLSIWK